MIMFLGVVIVATVVSVVFGLILGADVKFSFFPGIMIGSSHENYTLTYKEDKDKDDVKEMRVGRLEFCIVFISISVMWEIE